MATLESPARIFQRPKHHEGGIVTGRPDAGYRAFETLYAVYVAVPFLAGLDKFFNVLTEWSLYLSPILGGPGALGFMRFVGVIEMAAGILVAVNPRVGGKVVAAWLGLIVLNLLTVGYLDIVVRDIALACGAWCLSLLAREYGTGARTGGPLPRV